MYQIFFKLLARLSDNFNFGYIAYLKVLLLADPLANVETSDKVKWSQVSKAAKTTAITDGFSVLAKDVARAEESDDT